MIILRTKRFTYIGKTRKDEYTHLLGLIREEIYNRPDILSEIEKDAESLGYLKDDFIREMGIASRKHSDPNKIRLEVRNSRSEKTLVGYLENDDKISLVKYIDNEQQRLYSINRGMIDRITKKLDNAGLDDYDVATRIPEDSISITSDLGNLKIYLPIEYEYCQYDIDDFIRTLGLFRTKTVPDGDIYVMTVQGGRLNETQYFKLLKYIIEENEFITILEDK